jgi:hypothetical protein
MKAQTRKTSALTIKTLLHMAQPGARLLIVGSGAFLVNPSTHDHWYTNGATFDSLRANGWISAPVAIDANVAEAYIMDAGRDIAAAIESAKRGYTQLELEQVLEELESAAATQDAEPDEVTTEKESNPAMPLTTFERVAAHLADVTAEQIGKCHKIYGPDNRAFYAVENERSDTYEGQIIEYSVKYSPERGYTCTCPAGAEGFAHVHHASGVCKHVRWSVAAELEERAALAAIQGEPTDQEERRPDWYDERNETSHADGTRAHLLLSGSKEVDDATYARVVNAQPYPWTEEEIQRDLQRYAPRPFKLER